MEKDAMKGSGDGFSEKKEKWSRMASGESLDFYGDGIETKGSRNASKGRDFGEKSGTTREALGALAAEQTGDLKEELTTEQAVANLRGFIDLEAIAERENPNGLLGAIKEGAGIEKHIEAIQEEISENEVKLGEYEISLTEADEKSAEEDMAVQQKIMKRKKTWMYKVKQFFGIRDGRTLKLYEKRDKIQKDVLERSHETYKKMNEIERRSRQLSEKLQELDPEQPREEFLQSFETPLSNDGKKQNLKFGALAELSTDEYLAVWRRLRPNYVMKRMSNDAKEALENKTVNLGKEPKEKSVNSIHQELGKRSLRAVVPEKNQKAKDPDPVFVIFPTDVISSQLGAETNHKKNNGEAEMVKPDDLLISTKRGDVPVDAGVLFIPKNTNGKDWQYFENYFGNNPDKRPAHVVYYDDEPVAAVNDLLKGQRIIK